MELLTPSNCRRNSKLCLSSRNHHRSTNLLEMPAHQKVRSVRRKKRRFTGNRFTKKQGSGAEQTPGMSLDEESSNEDLGPSSKQMMKPNSIQKVFPHLQESLMKKTVTHQNQMEK